MWKKVIIGTTERGILYRNKQYVRVLTPGTYRFPALLERFTVDILDITKNPELYGAAARVLLREGKAGIEEQLLKVTATSREMVVVYENARASYLVRPGEERLFWRGFCEYRVERYDITSRYELDAETLRDIGPIMNERDVLTIKVPEQFTGILWEAGVIVRELSPGTYAFWRAQRDLAASVVDKRLTAIEVSGQEMLTKDKVSLRVNLTVSYRLIDALKAVRELSDPQSEIYRSAQLSLRQAIGEKTLDELLESKEALNRALASELAGTMLPYGVEITRTGVKDIILPGDMRVLFNQVVEAEKTAQAQNIRRREETAATRSLLNTAKMMENNPVLLRLKELEAVERVAEKVEKLTVFDGFDGIMKGLVSLK